MFIELDHVFIAASAGGPEIDALLSRGFEEGPRNTHPGQGTACRRIFFENAYLELIWLEDPKEAASEKIRRTRLCERLDPAQSANPFGMGLRSRDPEKTVPGFSTWDYCPPYLPEGLAIPVGVNSERLHEPLLFLLPGSRKAAWEPTRHPNGAKRITGISMAFPGADQPSPELQALLALDLFETIPGLDMMMTVELDGAPGNETVDLRPALPLLLRK